MTQNPADLTVYVGESARFDVDATCGDLSYQWLREGVGIQDATTPTLLFSPAAIEDSGVYSVLVSNNNGTTESATARLHVKCLGDVDGNGEVALSDLSALLSSYGACFGNARYNREADFDRTMCVDLDDLALLLSGFGIPCR